MLAYLVGPTWEKAERTLPQHKGVLALVVWMCHKIVPLALHALECILGRQVGKVITHLQFEFCFVSRERALVQHLIHVVRFTVEDRQNVFLHRVVPM